MNAQEIKDAIKVILATLETGETETDLKPKQVENLAKLRAELAKLEPKQESKPAVIPVVSDTVAKNTKGLKDRTIGNQAKAAIDARALLYPQSLIGGDSIKITLGQFANVNRQYGANTYPTATMYGTAWGVIRTQGKTGQVNDKGKAIYTLASGTDKDATQSGLPCAFSGDIALALWAMQIKAEDDRPQNWDSVDGEIVYYINFDKATGTPSLVSVEYV